MVWHLKKLGEQVWWISVYAPLRTIPVNGIPLKISQRKCVKSSITRQWIVRFGSNFIEFEHWRPQYYKSSTSRGQRSRSHQVIMRAKICQIVNNSAGGCMILTKFTTDYDHVTPDFKVNRSKVKVIAWQDVLAWKNRYISWTDSLTEQRKLPITPKGASKAIFPFSV